MKTNHRIFPDLSCDLLQIFTQRFIEKYPFIEKISVHHHAGLITDRQVNSWGLRYIMIFQIPYTPKIKKLDDATEEEFFIDVFMKHFEHFSGPPEVDSQFFPKREEWLFLLRCGRDPYPEQITETEAHWVLFERKDELIKSIVSKAKNEIDKLFNAVKNVGFSGNNPEATEKNWMNAAIELFDATKKEFKMIKREYLDDPKVYFFTGGQESRDFKGSLLKKVAGSHGLKIGARPLYEIYKKISTNVAQL